MIYLPETCSRWEKQHKVIECFFVDCFWIFVWKSTHNFLWNHFTDCIPKNHSLHDVGRSAFWGFIHIVWSKVSACINDRLFSWEILNQFRIHFRKCHNWCNCEKTLQSIFKELRIHCKSCKHLTCSLTVTNITSLRNTCYVLNVIPKSWLIILT